MSAKNWVLINAMQDIASDSFSINRGELSAAADCCQVALRTLRGGLRDGLRLLELDNGTVRVALLPDRGMGLWKAWCDGVEIGWQSPVRGPVHPARVAVFEPSGLGWLDGFDELLVRCGLESNGAPEFDESGRLRYPLHGRIANLPAQRVEVSIDEQTGEMSVTGVVDECRFHFSKLRLTSTLKLSPGSSRLEIRDEVENLSGGPAEAQMLYHINFGPPLHGPGARVVLPVGQIAPRDAWAAEHIQAWDSYGSPEPGVAERVNFFELLADQDGLTRALLIGPDGSRGVAVHFNTRQLPCFAQWKNTPPLEDGYVTGLEPATNFPNPRSFEGEQGRFVQLAPGESTRFDLAISFPFDAAAIAAEEAAIAALQGSHAPVIHRQPRTDWSAG